VSNPGPLTAVRHVQASFRVHQDTAAGTDLVLEHGSVLPRDVVYAAKACHYYIPPTGPEGVSTATLEAAGYGSNLTTAPLPLQFYNATERSARFSLPSHLHVEGPVPLALCYTTRELAQDPGLLEPEDFVQLQDTLTVIPEPQFLEGTPIRSITATSPDFKVYSTPLRASVGVSAGDKLFFAAECSYSNQSGLIEGYSDGNEYQANSTGLVTCLHDSHCTGMPNSTVLAMGHASKVLTLDRFDPTGGWAKVQLPSTPALVADGTDCELQFVSPEWINTTSRCVRRVLQVCYQTYRSEGVFAALSVPEPQHNYTVQADLYVEPQPIANIFPTYDRSQIFELQFNAREGDYFMLKVDDCNGARTAAGDVPGGPSYLTQLDHGGVAREKAIAQSQINELEDGTYKVCYATKSSEADEDNDFNYLSREIAIFESVAGHAGLSIATDAIAVGQDAVVHWSSDRGYAKSSSSYEDWIGLYRKGDCAEPEWWADGTERAAEVEVDPSGRHKCHLAVQYLEGGQTAGEARFRIEQAGEYEARFFQGDSRHGQGYVCRRLPGTGASTYMHCVLEAAAVSSTITVTADKQPVSFGSETTPGLETINTPYMY